MCVKCRLNRELSAGRKGRDTEGIIAPAVHKPHPAAAEIEGSGLSARNPRNKWVYHDSGRFFVSYLRV